MLEIGDQQGVRSTRWKGTMQIIGNVKIIFNVEMILPKTV